MNHDLFYYIVLTVFGISVLVPIVRDFSKNPRPKFKIPYSFIAGAAWGALALDVYKSGKVSTMIFIGFLGIGALYNINKRDREKAASEFPTGV